MTEKYKPGGALKSFLDAGKKPTRVLGSVERYVLSKPADRSRRTDVLHPSEMASGEWCYRASYFQLKGHLPLESSRRNSLRLQSVFAEGHGIHAKWQRWFQEMGNLYGKWHCIECDEYFWGATDIHEGPLEYKEVPLFYEPLRISGHADGWLLNFGDPLMLEVKSIGFGTIRWENPELAAEHGSMEKVWPHIKEPFAKHVTQVQIYMKLAELLGYDNYPQEAILIYENKATQDVKEFVVPKSDFGITPLFEAATMILNCVITNTPPECNLDKWGGCSKCGGYSE